MLPDDLMGLAAELDELGGVVSPDEAAPDLSGTDFALGRPIGSGGMGVVYEARQISLDRAVAVKTIRIDGMRDDGFRARFEAEAKLVARLHHPNIVGVHAAGAAANHVWYAMELVSGKTAAAHRFPDVRALAAFGLVVAEALDYAHRCGVVHRDVKPENVFIGDDGCVKLGDFGLAQLGEGAANSGGTRRYMAPETFERGEAGALSDQYALGLTLLELAAEIGGGRERDFAAILDRMTAHEPCGRYPDMASVAADLRRFLAHRPLRTVRNSPFHLFWLLTKRNPAAAWGGLLAAGLAAGLALSLLVGYARTSAALGKADEALRQVEREATSAAQAIASSLTVLDRSDPDKRETQLRTAIESVKALARRYPENPEIRAVLGRLRYAVEAHRRRKTGQ